MRSHLPLDAFVAPLESWNDRRSDVDLNLLPELSIPCTL